jgi:NAD(P)-dependent dehydrogenase (short-subunit alcohol dehydrogenase family)
MNILIGASGSGVAQALAAELSERGHQLFSIGRSGQPDWSQGHLKADLSAAESVQQTKLWLENKKLQPELVIQCAGILHEGEKLPEKTLTQVTDDWLQENFTANLLAHLHLAQAIGPQIKRSQPIRWVSLSAMVGSISDNQLGGWYSYRISKAALNMLIRNLHLEWSRKAPESIVVALHPGTTDTELSKPFQAKIAEGKLYSAELTGGRLADVVENLTADQSGQLLHWDGSIIPF